MFCNNVKPFLNDLTFICPVQPPKLCALSQRFEWKWISPHPFWTRSKLWDMHSTADFMNFQLAKIYPHSRDSWFLSFLLFFFLRLLPWIDAATSIFPLCLCCLGERCATTPREHTDAQHDRNSQSKCCNDDKNGQSLRPWKHHYRVNAF